MKKKTSILLGGIGVTAMICMGCSSKTGEHPEKAGEIVELNVVTTFSGTDSNAEPYEEGVHDWEHLTGNIVNDNPATANQEFKSRVVSEFEMDAEPDVLFFFTGQDANPFIEANRVVSIEEIREEFPEYASNMVNEKLPASSVDGKVYAIPANGYWEAMFVNTKVLRKCGIKKPGINYDWDQFMEDCRQIRRMGYTPVAASLGDIPHYWWEYSAFNNQSDVKKHTEIPNSVEEAQAWIGGMEDIRKMYEQGCFPENTLSVTDDETFQLFVQDKAAFLLDGSWKVGGIVTACQSDPDDPDTLDESLLKRFDIILVPAKGTRRSGDLIGGFSMGYYITRKAWENPKKKAAAVDFISFMTTDEMIGRFSRYTESPLKHPADVDRSDLNSLQLKAVALGEKVSGYTPAVQDSFPTEACGVIFGGMPDIVTGERPAGDVVEKSLEIRNELQ